MIIFNLFHAAVSVEVWFSSPLSPSLWLKKPPPLWVGPYRHSVPGPRTCRCWSQQPVAARERRRRNGSPAAEPWPPVHGDPVREEGSRVENNLFAKNHVKCTSPSDLDPAFRV
jgi:hypothetical protein